MGFVDSRAWHKLSSHEVLSGRITVGARPAVLSGREPPRKCHPWVTPLNESHDHAFINFANAVFLLRS